MVDGSNESLEHADQEYDPILRKGITLQKSFEKVDVFNPRGVFWIHLVLLLSTVQVLIST